MCVCPSSRRRMGAASLKNGMMVGNWSTGTRIGCPFRRVYCILWNCHRRFNDGEAD